MRRGKPEDHQRIIGSSKEEDTLDNSSTGIQTNFVAENVFFDGNDSLAYGSTSGQTNHFVPTVPHDVGDISEKGSSITPKDVSGTRPSCDSFGNQTTLISPLLTSRNHSSHGSISPAPEPSIQNDVLKNSHHRVHSHTEDNLDTEEPLQIHHQMDRSPDTLEPGILMDATGSGGAVDIPIVYCRRFLMLAIYCLLSMSNGFQTLQLNIIGNITAIYYEPSLPQDKSTRLMTIDWLAMSFMAGYIPLALPANWLLDTKGLKWSCVLGGFFNVLAAALKCGGISRYRFSLCMTGQIMGGISQVLFLNIPPRLSAVWFGPREVSTATSVGVVSNQIGITLSLILPGVIMGHPQTMSDIETGLKIMFYSTAASAIVIFCLIIIFFQKAPPHAPSTAQQLIVEAVTHGDYLPSLKRLFCNGHFVVLLIAFGITVGSFIAVTTLLDPIILMYFPGQEQLSGEIGVTMYVVGIVGAGASGLLLDRTKKFKPILLGSHALTLASLLAFTFTLSTGSKWAVFVTGGCCGLFWTSYYTVGFEFAAEILYPESEGTFAAVLYTSLQLIAILFILAMEQLLQNVSLFAAIGMVCGFIAFGLIISAMIKSDYKRHWAETKVTKQELTVEENIQHKKETSINH